MVYRWLQATTACTGESKGLAGELACTLQSIISHSNPISGRKVLQVAADAPQGDRVAAAVARAGVTSLERA